MKDPKYNVTFLLERVKPLIQVKAVRFSFLLKYKPLIMKITRTYNCNCGTKTTVEKQEGDYNDYVELYKLKCPVCGTIQYQNSLIINSKIKDK